MQKYLNEAMQAAQAAGAFIEQSADAIGKVDYKGRTDLVTDVDRTSEEIIIDHIQQAFPGHDILAEESGQETSSHEYRWVIDPLDGTTNYVHKYQHYAVSIALQHNSETIIGLVYNPRSSEMFTAIRGEGAWLNKKKIHVSSIDVLRQSLLSTGIPYELSDRWHKSIDLFKLFYYQSHGVRRDGSAALDLCYVAAGRFDGFWELDLQPWDVAAGMLIVQEAGGAVTRFDGSDPSLSDKEILATNGKIHKAMRDVIATVPF